MSRTHFAALALAASTLATSGCGGSSTSTTLTRAELIAKADAICGRVNAERRSLTANTQRDAARLAPPLAAHERAAVAEMRKLTPPASMANDWKQIVAAAQTLADDIATIGEYAKANKLDGKQARTLFSSDAKVQQQMLATARRDGFNDCALPK